MFPERLKKLRKQAGLSQESFAKDLNSSQSSVTNWENGRREPNMDMLMQIANYFGVSLDYLFGRVDLPNGHFIPKEKLPTSLVDSGVEAATKIGAPTLTEQEESVLKLFAQQLLAQQQQQD